MNTNMTINISVIAMKALIKPLAPTTNNNGKLVASDN
jgi:hypothetical protein